MAIIGVIETEFQSSTEEQSGGIGPLFKETRVVTPFAVGELATRALRAMQKAGVESVAALFVGEDDLLAEEGDDEVAIGRALKLLDERVVDEEAIDFSAVLPHLHQDLDLSITLEGSAEYEKGEPALAVLATGTELEPEGSEAPPEDWQEGALEDGNDDDGASEPVLTTLAPDYQAQMQTFLERVRVELDKELSLDEPDLRVWEEETADVTQEQRFQPGIGPTG
jgi:hypothetical protein